MQGFRRLGQDAPWHFELEMMPRVAGFVGGEQVACQPVFHRVSAGNECLEGGGDSSVVPWCGPTGLEVGEGYC